MTLVDSIAHVGDLACHWLKIIFLFCGSRLHINVKILGGLINKTLFWYFSFQLLWNASQAEVSHFLVMVVDVGELAKVLGCDHLLPRTF